MGRICLVTGGARSGKSRFAEEYLHTQFKDVLYIATAIPFDNEMKERIKKHKEQRPSHWPTYEGHRDLWKIVKNTDTSAILLDCVTIMITNLMFDHMGDKDITECDGQLIEKKISEEVQKLIEAVKEEYTGTIIMVTNEVGSGLVPEHALSRYYRDLAGRINQLIARQADEVYLAVSGIPVKIKGDL